MILRNSGISLRINNISRLKVCSLGLGEASELQSGIFVTPVCLLFEGQQYVQEVFYKEDKNDSKNGRNVMARLRG